MRIVTTNYAYFPLFIRHDVRSLRYVVHINRVPSLFCFLFLSLYYFIVVLSLWNWLFVLKGSVLFCVCLLIRQDPWKKGPFICTSNTDWVSWARLLACFCCFCPLMTCQLLRIPCIGTKGEFSLGLSQPISNNYHLAQLSLGPSGKPHKRGVRHCLGSCCEPQKIVIIPYIHLFIYHVFNKIAIHNNINQISSAVDTMKT